MCQLWCFKFLYILILIFFGLNQDTNTTKSLTLITAGIKFFVNSLISIMKQIAVARQLTFLSFKLHVKCSDNRNYNRRLNRKELDFNPWWPKKNLQSTPLQTGLGKFRWFSKINYAMITLRLERLSCQLRLAPFLLQNSSFLLKAFYKMIATKKELFCSLQTSS